MKNGVISIGVQYVVVDTLLKTQTIVLSAVFVL
jgi:hypothetical protein